MFEKGEVVEIVRKTEEVEGSVSIIYKPRAAEGIGLFVRDSANVLSSSISMIQSKVFYLSSYASAIAEPGSVGTVTLGCRSLKSCA